MSATMLMHRKKHVQVRRLQATLACLVAVAVMSGQTLAAEPKPAPGTDPELKRLDKAILNLRGPVGDMLKSGEVTDTQVFDRLYELTMEKFVLPSNAAVAKLHLTRGLVKKDLITSGAAAAPDAHDRLNSFLLSKLPEVAAGDPTPAVRVNAILLLGELDAQELKGGVGTAVPVTGALPKLLEAYQSAGQIDPVRVAALVGIRRHARSGITDKGQRDPILDAMLQTAAAKAPPVGRSEEGHQWVRSQAADVLAALGNTGTEQDPTAAVQALAGIVEDQSLSFPLRANATKALGQLKLESQPNLNLSRLAELITYFAVDVAKQEPTRRGLRHYLAAVEFTLRGPPVQPKPGEEAKPVEPAGILAKATAEPHKEYVTGLNAAIDPLLMMVRDDKVADEDLSAQAETAADDLATWLEENPPQAQGLVAGAN